MGTYSISVELCYDRMPKKVPTGEGEQGEGHAEVRSTFPLEEFEKSAYILGIPSSEFYNMCMFQFQRAKDAWLLKNGLNEEGQDSSKMTLEDLEKLKESLGR